MCCCIHVVWLEVGVGLLGCMRSLVVVSAVCEWVGVVYWGITVVVVLVLLVVSVASLWISVVTVT